MSDLVKMTSEHIKTPDHMLIKIERCKASICILCLQNLCDGLAWGLQSRQEPPPWKYRFSSPVNFASVHIILYIVCGSQDVDDDISTPMLKFTFQGWVEGGGLIFRGGQVVGPGLSLDYHDVDTSKLNMTASP